LLSPLAISRWLLFGFWHSLVVFYLYYFMYQDISLGDIDYCIFQAVIGQAVVILVNLKILLDANHWTWPLVLVVFFSILSYFLINITLHSIGPIDNFLLDNSDIYMSYLTALSDPMTWLYTLLAVVVALLPDLVYRVVCNTRQKSRHKHNQTAPLLTSVNVVTTL